MAGLSVGGFIGIVVVILILNVAAVIGYKKFTEKNPDKAVSVNLDSGLVPKIRYVECSSHKLVFNILLLSFCLVIMIGDLTVLILLP